MVIKQVFYTEKAKKHGFSLDWLDNGLDAISYENSQLPPNSLLLGSNGEHNLALFLSNLPLVVIDRHSDMYETIHEECGPHAANWVYHALLQRRRVHLVLPDIEKAHLKECVAPIAAISKGRLHLYSFEELGKHRFGGYHSIEAEPIKRLHSRLKGRGKQVSIDFDFIECAPKEKIGEVLEPIINDSDIYDFWLNEPLFVPANKEKVKIFEQENLEIFQFLWRMIK